MSINKRFETIIKELYGNNQSSFAKAIGVTPTVIANVVGSRQGKPSFDVMEKVCANANISARWLLTGKGSMFNKESNTPESSVTTNPRSGIPYYDVDFIGGFCEIFNNQTITPQNYITIQGFEKADCWCNVSGHSMEPKINHGDIIALRKSSVEDILYGEIYAVVTNSIRTIKIIRKSRKPNILRFIPINIDEFDEKEYPISDIIQIYKVIGSIRKFF